MIIKKIISILIVSLGFIVMNGFVFAQITLTQGEQTPEGVSPGLIIEKTQILVRPLLITDVPLNEPVAIDLGGLSVTGISPSLTTGITVKAFTRYVEYEGQRIGQLVLTAVEKNGARELLPSNIFNAQFNMDQTRLEPGQDIIVEGDAVSLIAALEKLAETETVAQEEDEAVEQETIITQNDPGSQQQNSGSGQSNDLAGAYQAPESVYVAPDGEEVINVTVAGCSVRIDIPQMQAYQQSRTETVKDGAVISTSECTDDLSNAFPLQNSYSVCSENVDLAAFTATAQYVLYYTDAGGARQEVTSCADDSEKVFPIVERPESCSIYLDYAAFEAVPQAALIYQDDSNVEIQVRGCEASTIEVALPMAQTIDGCTMRHDYNANVSYELAMWVYSDAGLVYQATPCIETGITYVHNKAFTTSAGNNICTEIVDMTAMETTFQYRTEISINGAIEYISECTPDPTSSTSVVSTTDTCNAPSTWEHDLTAGASYGMERFYYMNNGFRDYVTYCQQSTEVYAHQVEVAGWQDNNDQLYSYELSTVYISPASGRYDIAVSQVLSGAVQMPYILTGTEERENGTVSYEGCSKFAETSNFEQWKRPDNTIYEKAIGAGSQIGPTTACSVTTWPSVWTLISSNVSGVQTNCVQSGGAQARRTGVYEGTYVVSREDGAVITNSTATSNRNCGTGSYCYINGVDEFNQWYPTGAGAVPPSCQNTVGSPTSLNWNTAQGWTLY